MTTAAECTNNSPSWFHGHWKEWHRGHGCDKDDGKPATRPKPTGLELVQTFTTARTYYFRLPGHLEWALCTVNDATGELAIISDWGNWSHLWNPRHIGSPSLTHFIAIRDGGKSWHDHDYVACKLLGRKGAQALDVDATIKAWRKTLCERRLEQGREGSDNPPYFLPYEKRLGRELAREIWDDIGDLVDDERDESIFIEHATQITGFARWVTESAWDDTVHKHSHEYKILTDTILPALAKACAETVDERAAAHFTAEGITAS